MSNIRLNDIDLNLLKIFIAIYEEKNLTKAGNKIGLTQPAVSNALLRLRNSLNDSLFIKNQKEMSPTDYSHQLYHSIIDVFNVLGESIQKSSFDPFKSKRTFYLTMGDYNESIMLPKLLQEIEKKTYSFNIKIKYISADQMPLKLQSGEIDLAIGGPIHIGKYLDSQNFYKCLLIREEYVCLTNKQHKSSLTFEDYINAEHITVAAIEGHIEKVDRILEELKFTRNIRLKIPHFYNVPKIVAETKLIATIGKTVAQEAQKIFPVQYHKLPFELKGYDISLYWHVRSENDSANLWLRELFKSLFTQKTF